MNTLLKTIALPLALLLHLAVKFVAADEFTADQNFNTISHVVEESKSLPSLALDEATEKIKDFKVQFAMQKELSQEEVVKEIDTKDLESVYVVLN